jgi:hypothetical protein
MRRIMQPVIFSAALLLITLVSCKPQKAIELKAAIVQKERIAFNILLDKNGPGEQKLASLVKDDYKGALAFVDQEEKEFDKLIAEIAALPADGIQQGNELKTAALDYYGALKDLQIYDRQEIVQREASSRTEGEALRAAQDSILQLSRRKQDMFKKVYEKESAFHQALEKFSSVNGI